MSKYVIVHPIKTPIVNIIGPYIIPNIVAAKNIYGIIVKTQIIDITTKHINIKAAVGLDTSFSI